MVSISIELFLDAIALLIVSRDLKSLSLIDDLLNIYADECTRSPASSTALNTQFVQLLNQLKKLPREEKESGLAKTKLLIKFFTHPDVKRDSTLLESMKELFKAAETLEDRDVVTLQKKISNALIWNKCSRINKMIGGKLAACASTMDEDKQELLLNDSINLSRQVIELSACSDRLASGAVERILFSDKESIREALNNYKSREVTGKLQTGLQGLNLMLGQRGGFARGESVCIFALQHNFKSGLLMTIARGIARFNKPIPSPVNKRPLILFVSLENEANCNMMKMFEVAYETIYQKSCIGLSDEEIINFVHDFYTENGFELAIERYEGRKFGVDEYINLIESYEASGYEVYASLLDYADKMRKGSNRASSKYDKRGDEIIGELFNGLCNFNKIKKILFITAHQFNREAMRLAKGEQTFKSNNVVKEFGSWCAAGSIGPSQEIDCEIFIHLETNHNGKKFLTVQRGKHRYVDHTKEAHKYFAYPFTEFGIGDDVGEEPKFVRDIYAVSDDEQQSNDDNLGSPISLDNEVF